jgi:predicted phage-related endonuclease
MNIDSVRAHVEILRFVATKKAELKEMEEASRAAIEEALGDNEVGELDGAPAVNWTRVTSRRLDQKALKAEHPDIVAEYTRPSESRRFGLA